MQVKFTPLELRELGELRDVDMIVHEEDFDYDEASRRAIESNKQITVIDRIFTQWRQRELPGDAQHDQQHQTAGSKLMQPVLCGGDFYHVRCAPIRSRLNLGSIHVQLARGYGEALAQRNGKRTAVLRHLLLAACA